MARAVVYMASLPLDANVLFLTVMATKMPLRRPGLRRSTKDLARLSPRQGFSTLRFLECAQHYLKPNIDLSESQKLFVVFCVCT